jgi:hypothetical protein
LIIFQQDYQRKQLFHSQGLRRERECSLMP